MDFIEGGNNKSRAVLGHSVTVFGIDYKRPGTSDTDNRLMMLNPALQHNRG